MADNYNSSSYDSSSYYSCESEDEESLYSNTCSSQALQNHYRSESEDEESFYCDSCNRSFGSSQALQNHYSQSLRHNYCRDCDRDFGSWQALQSHYSQSSRHNYCRDCERHFRNANDLRIHRASKLHQTPFISCPICGSGFVSAAALTKHMEKSKCHILSNKQIVNKVRDWEQKSGNPNLITLPRVVWYNNNDDFMGAKTYATEASFDGQSYVCLICGKGFRKLPSLNQHLNSNVHGPSEFRCRKCGKTFNELSALVEHVESEACSIMTAEKIRNIVNSFKNMSLTN